MSLIFPNFEVKLIFSFPISDRGLYPKFAGKGPELAFLSCGLKGCACKSMADTLVKSV